MKKSLILLLLIILGLSGFYLFQQHQQQTANLTELRLYGNVDIREVNLGFKVAGRVEKLLVDEGDQVKAGDLLATLDQTSFQDELALAKAKLDAAEAVLVKAEKLYQRSQGLAEKKAISEASYDEVVSGRDQAIAQVNIAKSLVSLAETRLADTQLFAPSDGIVLTRVREKGSIVSAGLPIYSIALTKPVWIRAYVDEPNLAQLYPGQIVTVLTDSGKTYQGKIGFISPQAEFTPKNVESEQLRTELVYRFKVLIDQTDQGLRQGMPVTLVIQKKVSEEK
ncbi:efflux RND transporter periplasmic adaptor subunit [Gallibacterium sp. AGMB14963]|uniref:efflux RND transporter periplasmic adaptor subunit n=1 Tax=Gallibacterium faecale TaxID=3019086 RepID=UPI0022F1A4CE|nr:efflux RND transporter periplasmic adaptor subunit [Gallibacterium sp. AGMB14963]MDA3978807.1 efflux RND transporter periplasmic adaptor subunit [Gallibacterium sp. AGMB14963]